MKTKRSLKDFVKRIYAGRKAIGTLTIISLFMVLIGFINAEKKETSCQAIEVIIDDQLSEHAFISESDVLGVMYSSEMNPIGKKLTDINTAMLESRIRSNPYVSEAEVFSTIDGSLVIDLKQRIPLFRVINQSNEQFYIDTTGHYMPLSDHYTADVITVSGNIQDGYRNLAGGVSASANPVIYHVYHTMKYISKSVFWNANTVQLYINEESDIELIPRMGNYRIILGNSDRIDEKFQKLDRMYQYGLPAKGWDTYSVLNVKFRNQIVCTRNQKTTKQ